MIPSVFLSHNWQDKSFARELASDLMRYGVYVWIDEAEIQVGDSLVEKIRNGIDVVDYLIVVLSPDSVKSEWVKKEVDIAINQEIRNKRVKVLPVMHRHCELPWFLEGKLYADFTDSKYYKTSLEKLLATIGVKDTGFHKQNSIFQRVESLLRPVIRQVDKAISAKPPETDYEWNFNSYMPIPDEHLLHSFEAINSQYGLAKPQALELLSLPPEHLSIVKECTQIYADIISMRKEKIKLASLLESEANARRRTSWYERMQKCSRELLFLHSKYSGLTKTLRMSISGERLWCVETLIETESRLDALYLDAYHIAEFDKAIG